MYEANDVMKHENRMPCFNISFRDNIICSSLAALSFWVSYFWLSRLSADVFEITLVNIPSMYKTALKFSVNVVRKSELLRRETVFIISL